MAANEQWRIDHDLLLHDTKSAFSVCAGFQAEIKIAMALLSAELSNPSSDRSGAVNQIVVNDLEPCVEFLQITFDRIQVQLDAIREQCISVR